MTFSLTPAATREILAAAARSDAQGLPLRVAARQTPDGIDYGMGFDPATVEDEVAVFDGLTVVVGEPSRRWLADTVLDYVEIEPGRHDIIFVAAAPAAAPGCGSGGCAGCSR
jgi:Fe-S cluster assembly iron-binding protein IscA